MIEEKSVLDLVLEHEKEGEIVFRGAEDIMSMDIKTFIQQPADGILYDLNRDKVTLLSQYSQENIRWINDYAVAVTITALRAANDELIECLRKEIAEKERIQSELDNPVRTGVCEVCHDECVEEAGRLRKKARDWELCASQLRRYFELVEK